MDATTIVAIAGLSATTTLGLLVPIINGRIADRNARRAKAHDLVIAAYTDAMIYIQNTQIRLDLLVDVSARAPQDLPADRANVDAISARLWLAAPPEVFRCWLDFRIADDRLHWYLSQEYEDDGTDVQGLPEETAEIVEVRRTAGEAADAMRRAIGAPDLAPQRSLKRRSTSS